MTTTKTPEIAGKLATRAVMRNLPRLLLLRKMSQTELARATGIDVSNVNKLCRQTYTSSLSLDFAMAISKALDVTLDELTK